MPSTTVPGGYFSATWSHGLACVCFMPSEISCLSWLMPRTTHFDLVADVDQLAGMVDPLASRTSR